MGVLTRNLEEVHGNGPEGVHRVDERILIVVLLSIEGWFDEQFVRREIDFKLKYQKRPYWKVTSTNNKSDENSDFFFGK